MTSLSGEYKKLREVGADFVTHAEWGARYDYSNERAVVEPATQVFVHITITEPNNYLSHEAHVRAIEAIGISRFPSTGISYNRVILFGVSKPYIGQKMSRRGAHTVNNYGTSTCQRWGSQCPGQGGSVRTPGGSTNLNYSARAYAYGANTHHSVTDSVVDTFARSIAGDIKAGFVRRDAKIHGHRCVSAKSCPGDRMWDRMHDLEHRVEHYLEDDDMPSPKDWTDQDWYVLRNRLLMADLARDSGNGAQITPWAEDNWPDHLATTVAGLLGYVAVYSRDAAGAVKAPVRWEDGSERTAAHTLSWLQRAITTVMEAQQGSDAPAILAKLDEVAAADAARDQAVLDAIESLESGDGDAALAKLRDLLDAALTD